MALKSKFEEQYANASGSNDRPTMPEVDNHTTEGNSRTICFELHDGALIALNYAYLTVWKCNKDGDVIELVFTTHTVTLKGYNLRPLFEILLLQLPVKIKVRDVRYDTRTTPVDGETGVLEIIVLAVGV